MEGDKLWGGRFTSSNTDRNMEKLNSSIETDKRMYAEDLEGSKAYATALKDANLLTSEELSRILEGLDLVKSEWDRDAFEIKRGDEDVHTANERRLKELIGEAGAKLHVGRSRNDQVITDMRLWLRTHLRKIDGVIRSLISVLVERSIDEIDVLMPGYTHLQRAQPVRWSHYLLSHAATLKKDSQQIENILESISELPLGSGALAGNPFDIDRFKLARLLGFQSVTLNSMQSVGDRDFIAQFLFWSSMVGTHLSRLAEDLILYSSKEFDFISLHETYSTGSSLMPQKRNPDSLELARGIGGSLFGQCCSFMMVLKGLPSTYNKDLQCDKELMFSTYDKLKLIVEVTTGTIRTLQVNGDKCRGALNFEMLATDVAYYLVRKGVPFREAHRLAGKVVAESERKNVALSDLSVEELQTISPHFDQDIVQVWNYENSVEQYKTFGGTSKSSVLQQIDVLKEWLKLT